MPMGYDGLDFRVFKLGTISSSSDDELHAFYKRKLPAI